MINKLEKKSVDLGVKLECILEWITLPHQPTDKRTPSHPTLKPNTQRGERRAHIF